MLYFFYKKVVVLMKHCSLTLSLCLILTVCCYAQSHENLGEDPHLPAKVLHAEPLYIDLIRDLGARKGEKEWNVGAALVDRGQFDSYEFLVEYEWAVMDRWGLEIEVPVSLHSFGDRPRRGGNENGNTLPTKPSNRVESLKLATQYTFLVSERRQMSLAVGAITELELTDLDAIQFNNALQGVLFNPFFIAAKRLGPNWHSLIYTGPRLLSHFGHKGLDLSYEINTNFHYMIPGSRNFIGVEFNKLAGDGYFHTTIRPQMRLAIQDNLMIGIVPGISLNREKERLSAFVRVIYEPH